MEYPLDFISSLEIQNNVYRIYPKYWNKQIPANSADPDQTSQNAVSDQDLHCLLLILQSLNALIGSKMQAWIQGDFDGVRFDQITVLTLRIRKNKPEQTVYTHTNALERGIWSGSTLIATHPAILHTFTGVKWTCWREV